MIKLKKRGSLLFELFVALMILSVGIVSILRVFGEALFVGQRNVERAEAKKEIENLVFEWLVNPATASFTENGSVTVPLDHGKSRYWCEIRSQNMVFPVAKAETKSQEKKSEIFQKPSPYYQVHFLVTRDNGTPIFNLDTVLIKVKKANAI